MSPRPSEPVELAPSENAGQTTGIDSLPGPRRAVVVALKKRWESTAEQLAADLGVTVGAVRQQLSPLGEDGLVAWRDERRGSSGRPRRWYCLAPAAESLFPKRYGQLTNQLLGFIEESDPSLVAGAFEKRAAQRRERAEARLAGLGFEAKVRELARILDEDGYLAGCSPAGDGSWLISELNCAILDVARHHREACGSELAFIRAVLPDATVERVTHILSGGHSCSYRITPAVHRTAEPAS